MKFHVITSDFQKAISSVEGIISIREIKSALSNIKIETTEDKILLSATDLEISIRTSVPAKILSEGKGSVPAKQLSNILRLVNFPETSVEIVGDSEGTEQTLIKDAQEKIDFKMTINGISSDELKTIDKVNNDIKKEIPCFTLANMIKKTYSFIAVEDTRYVFNGLFLKTTPEKIIVAGTDGRRLAKIEREIQNDLPFEKGVIIPHKAIREILKLIETHDSGKMSLLDNQIYLEVNGSELLCKLIDGNYPDYEAVIPKETKYVVRLNKENFNVVLKQALIAAQEPNKQIRFGFSKGNLNINSSTPGTTEVSINIPVEYEGEDLLIALKGEYLTDLLKSIDDTDFDMRFSSPNAPVIFKDPSDEKFISVMMPMKL
jgi:DNA polymerase-3 subunit beta